MKKIFQRTGCFQLPIALALLTFSLILAVAMSIASTEKNTQLAPTLKVQKVLPDITREEQKLSYATKDLGTILTGESVRKRVLQRGSGMASRQISQAIQQWLNQFGTAKVTINVNDNFAMQESSLDWLLPLYDNKKNMFFTQLGARRIDDRNIFNWGWGWRSEIGDWLYGFNNFFDHDYIHENWRSSIGLEAWTNYLQLSANRYMRMSGWHQAVEFADYNERPAGGFDLRMNSYLPVYPQLGSNLMFEKYYGNQVALFGRNNLQKDPYAFTFGLNYTPIPLLTLGVNKRVGKAGENDTNINMQLTYRFSDPLLRQLSSADVNTIRRLSKSRYDLVDRNNYIVLEYKKQTLITLELEPNEITNTPGYRGVVTGIVNNKYPLSSIQWVAPAFLAAPGASITQLTPTTFEVTLPSYVPGGGSPRSVNQQNANQQSRPDNHYQLVATASDINGNVSKPATLLINVEYPTAAITTNNLAVVVNNAPANNSATNQVSATLLDGANNPLPGEIVTFTANNSATILTPAVPTNSNGVAITSLTNTIAGTTAVTASINNTAASINTNFTANNSTATILAGNLTVTSDNALANNIATNAVQALVTDSNNNPVPNVNVSFSANNSATIVTTPAVTDANGIARTTLRNTRAGITVVTATINSQSRSVNTNFVADPSTAILTGGLTVTRNNAVANNVATNAVQVLVTDQNNNPLSGFVVNFSATNSATVTLPSVTSDANGIAATTLRSTTAGNSDVTATLVATGASVNGTVTFIANASTARFSGSLTVTRNNATANNVETNAVQVLVTDQNNNPVPGVVVSFSATNSATVTSPSVTTDANGIAATTLSSTTAGNSDVTATLVSSGAQLIGTVTFDVDPSSPTLSGTLTVTADNALANNVSRNAVQVLVTDHNNNPLSGVVINFTATNGATVVTSSVTSDADGIAATTLRSTKAGNSTVTATLTATSSYVNGTVTFTADSSTPTLSGNLTVTTNNAVANNVATNAVQVLVTDQYNNPLSGFVVNFTATNSATVVTTSVTSNASGIAATTLRSTKAGNSTVTATLATTGVYVNGTVTFVGDPATAVVTLTVITNNALADGVEEDQVQASVVDAFNNPVANLAVTFSATNSASTTPTTANTNASGQLTSDFTNNNGSGGASTVTASLPNGNTGTANINFIALTLTGINTPVNPRLYGLGDGFPTTASHGLNFQFEINNVTTLNSKFTWTSSQSSVASINSTGNVTFQSQPTGGIGGSITFTGTLITNSSYTVSYTANIVRWFYNRGTYTSTYLNIRDYCNGQPNGQGLTGVDNLSNRGGGRGVGGFYDEWGNLANYGNGWQSSDAYWSNTYNAVLPTGYWIANLGTGSKGVWLITYSGYMVCASETF